MGFLLVTTLGGLIVYHQRTLREYERMQPDFQRHLALENAAFDRGIAQLLAEHRALVEGSNLEGIATVDEDLLAEARAEVEEVLRRDPLEERFDKLEGHDAGKKKKKDA